jgi:glycosyltransferase involved in cell wall biosynthesis
MEPMASSDLSVVVPVYNSEASLPLLVQRLDVVLKNLGGQFEVLLVNDDSQDNSWKVIEKLSQMYPAVRGIALARNYGQHNALLCGIRAARFAIIVTIDDDLQDRPEEIPNLIAPLAKDWDVVYGVPSRGHHGLWRDCASNLIKWSLQKAMRTNVARNVSAFRAFRRSIADAFLQFQGAFFSLDVLLAWGTTRFTSITVPHDPRPYGKSNYTFVKLMGHALNLIVGFTVLPLRLTTIVGLCASIFGVIVLIFILASYVIRGGSIPGFPFLASIISIFSGVQLFCLGIMGEYMGRIYSRTMNKPAYLVRMTTFESHER